MLLSRAFFLLFFSSFFIFFSSCNNDDEMDNNNVFDLPSCLPYGDLRGTAEINGAERWLTIGEVGIGESISDTKYQFIIGGPTLDCSIYEEVTLKFIQETGVDVSGTYEVVMGDNREVGFAYADFESRLEDEIISNKFDIISGTATIEELELFKYEVTLEGLSENGQSISLRFTNLL